MPPEMIAPRPAHRAAVRASRDARGGYTLTEMLIVIVIIGLIAAVVTPGIIGQLGRARAKAASLQLENVSAALESFRSDVGRYPSTQEGLSALVTPPQQADGWVGPYLRSVEALKDPWGAVLIYTATETGRSYDVASYGADGVSGGTDVDRDLHIRDGR